MLPPDLQAIVDQIEAIERQADALVGGLTDEEFFWQPDGGRRWSVAQCLDHLAAGADVYAAALRPVIDDARRRGIARRGPGAPGFFGRKFVDSLEPPVRMRGRAPKTIVPRPNRTRAEIMRAFHDGHAAMRQIAADCAEIDTSMVTFTNPFLTWVRMRVATGLNVIPAHARRHLWQAANVVASLRSLTSPEARGSGLGDR